ncbi:rust resistance kinase Lr10-like [Phoenix dactylifera]|uniref:Rust resistance kinase Lr10-like n=1 Tax=Phoenix dactylifera TaxID=42345 RepID=A0A8B9A8N0_PHODC|nr:rust resistance kinase Lr10-like [Phoenix dactylifera]
MSMDKLPFDCMVVSAGAEIPTLITGNYYEEALHSLGVEIPSLITSYIGSAIDFIERGELTLDWSIPEISIPEISDKCKACEAVAKRCAGHEVYCNTSQHLSSKNTNQHHGSDVKLITGILTGAIVTLVLAALILLYIFKKSDTEKETQLKVERFLAMYKTTKPTRYTFVEVKKMTRRFKHKLGQGGFGSVYKGELPNGIPVAVKMLEKSKGEGEEFINEVATIGRIHHVNVVRLLGFCSERTRHALGYEFMPNESLEKYIYSRENTRAHESFCIQKLLEIVKGIARGIEYLHQGCDQRILHFDIKPHNILLDYDFNPKISDFGLAKLCSRDRSIITMTAARGTMGYIAPEMYSRNFGTVSYKSDIYSFGMLILEMVGGKKSKDPEIENQNEVYFPEKVYEWIVHGQDLGLNSEMNGREEEIVKKLAIVALWCIQWNPADRPSMTRVIQMLTGDLQSLQIPPKPFISSSDH